MNKIWSKWWLARLEFILAAIEFGIERWLYQFPRQEKNVNMLRREPK